MSRSLKLLFSAGAALAVVALASACGTERITVPSSQTTMHSGAVLFAERCSGCHTLAEAATHGSASNIRTAQYNNGPNFNVRCERPVARVLYAIENGGFSGAIMPQNIVVGQDARNVAMFVATYAGSKTPKVPGVIPCAQQQVGSIPTAAQLAAVGKTTQATGTRGGASQVSAAAGTPKAKVKAGGPAASSTPGKGGSPNTSLGNSRP